MRKTAAAQATTLVSNVRVSTALSTVAIASGEVRQAIIRTGRDSANMARYVMTTQITRAQVKSSSINLV